MRMRSSIASLDQWFEIETLTASPVVALGHKYATHPRLPTATSLISQGNQRIDPGRAAGR